MMVWIYIEAQFILTDVRLLNIVLFEIEIKWEVSKPSIVSSDIYLLCFN